MGSVIRAGTFLTFIMAKMKRSAPSRKPYIRQVRATRPSIRMSNNPGPFVTLPWYKFTYELERQVTADNQAIRVTVGDVLNQIKSRLQFSDTSTVRIKVQNARVWVTAGQGLGIPAVVGSFFNTTNDTPSRYPASDRMVILDGNGATNPLVVTQVKKNQSTLTVRINVCFQTGANPGA